MSEADRAHYIRLLGFLKPYWRAFLFAVLCMICTAATSPVLPAIMRHLLDSGFKTNDARMVSLIPLSIVLLFVVQEPSLLDQLFDDLGINPIGGGPPAGNV